MREFLRKVFRSVTGRNAPAAAGQTANALPDLPPLLSLSGRESWSVAVAVVRELIRYRRSAPLSERVSQTDPAGTLILRREQFAALTRGLPVAEAVALFDAPPCIEKTTYFWTTLGGSTIQFTADRKNERVEFAAFSHALGRAIQKATPRSGDSLRGDGPRDDWPMLSTEHVGRYFLAYANGDQLQWLAAAMCGIVRFEAGTDHDGRPTIEQRFDHDEPDFMTHLRPGDGPPRNQLTDVQIDALWASLVQLGAADAIAVRNRLMEAVNWSVRFATPDRLAALLDAVQQADVTRAEQLCQEIADAHRESRLKRAAAEIKRREQHGPLFGRDYKRPEEGAIWSYYRLVVSDRDRSRCQHCGLATYEHDQPLYHVDHIVPVSRGGATTLANLQLLCPGCNLAKGNKLESEFPATVRAAWHKNRRDSNR